WDRDDLIGANTRLQVDLLRDPLAQALGRALVRLRCLEHHDDVFGARLPAGHTHGGDATLAHTLDARRGALHAVRVVLLTRLDDDLLRAPADEELVAREVAQISRPEPAVAQDLRGRRGVIEVSREQ